MKGQITSKAGISAANPFNRTRKSNEESRYHRIIHPNMYAKVKALAKAEGISDVEAYDKIIYDLRYEFSRKMG